MFSDGDVFRLDVAAREAVSELAFWLDGVLEGKEKGLSAFILFVCLFVFGVKMFTEKEGENVPRRFLGSCRRA